MAVQKQGEVVEALTSDKAFQDMASYQVELEAFLASEEASSHTEAVAYLQMVVQEVVP